MAATDQSGDKAVRPSGSEDPARRVGALLEGLSIAQVLKADEQEMVIELSDGTRLFVRAEGRLDISVT